MPTKKEASEKQQATEGVALRITEQSDRYKDGVPVAVPTDASAATEPKSGQQAATPKEQ